MIEAYTFDTDIPVICITATGFPDGVLAAHQKLHTLVAGRGKRKYFGISYPEEAGNIIYHAAAGAIVAGEAAALHCSSFTIRKGSYNSIFIQDFMTDIPAIGNAFRQLLALPGIDPNGYCLEMYEGENDVRCMVPLKN